VARHRSIWENGIAAPVILNLEVQIKASGQFQAPAAVLTGYSPQHPWNRETRWAPEMFWTIYIKDNPLALTENRHTIPQCSSL